MDANAQAFLVGMVFSIVGATKLWGVGGFFLSTGACLMMLVITDLMSR